MEIAGPCLQNVSIRQTKETWRRTFERDLKAIGLSLETAPQVAAERDKWKSLVDASSASPHRED
jgi:hypothetical protein